MNKPNTITQFGISENFKYLFTNKGVCTISSKKNDLNGGNWVGYNDINSLPIAIQIMKENLDFKYKINKIDIVEYTSKPRKFLYQLVEIFELPNNVSVINEWEKKFGSKLLLINESEDSLLIEQRVSEAWEGTKQIINEIIDWIGDKLKSGADWVKGKAKGAADWVKDKSTKVAQAYREGGIGNVISKTASYAGRKAKEVWNSVKEGIMSAWKCVTSDPVKCIMEGIRTLANSAIGTGILTGISFIPVVGQVTNGIIFGSLLIYDIYLTLSGKASFSDKWMDILINMVSILMPAAGKAMTPIKALKSLPQLGQMAATKGGIFAKVVNAIKNGLSKLSGIIGKAASWLGEKLGMTWLKNWGDKAIAKVGQITSEITQGAGGAAVTTGGQKAVTATADAAGSTLSKIRAGTPSLGTMVKAGGQTFALTAGMCAFMGMNPVTCNIHAKSGDIPEDKLLSAKQAEEKMGQISAAASSSENQIAQALGQSEMNFML